MNNLRIHKDALHGVVDMGDTVAINYNVRLLRGDAYTLHLLYEDISFTQLYPLSDLHNVCGVMCKFDYNNGLRKERIFMQSRQMYWNKRISFQDDINRCKENYKSHCKYVDSLAY